MEKNIVQWNPEINIQANIYRVKLRYQNEKENRVFYNGIVMALSATSALEYAKEVVKRTKEYNDFCPCYVSFIGVERE
jgi:hypothetical protein